MVLIRLTSILSVMALVACTSRTGAGPGLDDSSCYPNNIPGFQRVTMPDELISSLKAYRNTSAAGYNASKNALSMTIYIYDRNGGSEDEMKLEVASSFAEVLSVHPGSELAMHGAGVLPVAGNQTDAYGGLFLWSDRSKDYGSFLWLVMNDRRFLKVRATYVRPEDDGETGQAVQHAMESIKAVVAHVCSPA